VTLTDVNDARSSRTLSTTEDTEDTEDTVHWVALTFVPVYHAPNTLTEMRNIKVDQEPNSAIAQLEI
jgi:hypothetical protein